MVSRRNRLIQEVVMMVLRGAQFHRFGPAGCAFLTRRALSSYQTRFRQEQFDVVHPPQEGRMTSGHGVGLHRRDLYGNLTKDSHRAVRADEQVHLARCPDCGGMEIRTDEFVVESDCIHCTACGHEFGARLEMMET